jgi:hypothetical protein
MRLRAVETSSDAGEVPVELDRGVFAVDPFGGAKSRL